MTMEAWWRPATAEFIGTFTLVFVGAGSIITLGMFGGGASGGTLVAIALAHGLAIAVMITALGHISGGHFNPAVTVAALFTKRIKPDLGVLYILFQLLGGVVGAFMLVACLPSTWWDAPGVHLATPDVRVGLDPAKALLVEAVLTFFLVFVVFGTGIDTKNPRGAQAGFAIGLTITIGILMGGTLTGAAMNPARAFGPALISGSWAHQYIYWAGPLLGGIVAGLVYDSAFLEQRPRPGRSEAATAPPAESGAAPPAT